MLLRHQIEQMLSAYWYELDSNNARQILGFYTDDCHYRIDNHPPFTGKQELAAFYAQREARGYRLTRHCMTNLHVTPESDGGATARFIVTNYGDTRPPPITDLQAPAMVCDVECRCQRGQDGAWRIAGFLGRLIFIGPDPFSREVLIEDSD